MRATAPASLRVSTRGAVRPLHRAAPPLRGAAASVCRSRRGPCVLVRAEAGAAAPPPAPPPVEPPAASPSGNGALAGGAAALGVALFVLSRAAGGTSLAALQAEALPIDQALGNGRPTVVEFYADWCEVCRETAPNVADVERALKGKLNFVMLNVDNASWAPEMSEYDVDGIPHFVFLDGAGKKQGTVVGRLPREVLRANADALVGGQPLPFAKAAGATSGVAAPDARLMAAGPGADPRRGDGSTAADPRAHSWN